MQIFDSENEKFCPIGSDIEVAQRLPPQKRQFKAVQQPHALVRKCWMMG